MSCVRLTHSACNTREPINDPSDIYPDLNITVLPGLVARVGDEITISCVADKPRYQFSPGTRPKPPTRVIAAFDNAKFVNICRGNGGLTKCSLTVPLTMTGSNVSVACNAANDNGCRTLIVLVTVLEKKNVSTTASTSEGNRTTTDAPMAPEINVTTPQSGKNVTTELPKSATPVSTAGNLTSPVPTTVPTRNKGEIYKAILFYKLTRIWVYTVCANKKANFFRALCGHSIQGRNDGILTKQRTSKLWSLHSSKGTKSINSFGELNICKLIQKTCSQAVYEAQKLIYKVQNPVYKAHHPVYKAHKHVYKVNLN